MVPDTLTFGGAESTPSFWHMVSSVTPTVQSAVQILFYIVVGTLSILTYLQARRSFLSPFASKAYEKHLAKLEEVHGFFSRPHYGALADQLDLYRLFSENARIMLECFYRVTFGRSYSPSFDDDWFIYTFPEVGYSDRTLSAYPDSTLGPMDVREGPETDLSLKKWSEYRHDMVCRTRKCTEAMHVITLFSQSPFLPPSVRMALDDFIGAYCEYIDWIGLAMSTLAKELPERYSAPVPLKIAEDGVVFISDLHDWITDEDTLAKVPSSPPDLREPAAKVVQKVADALDANKLWRELS